MKKTYFSLRMVHGTSTEKAIQQVVDGKFHESHRLSDKVLTKDEMLTEFGAIGCNDPILVPQVKNRIRAEYDKHHNIEG